MPTITKNDISTAWTNLVTDLSLVDSVSYILQNVSPYPLEIKEKTTLPDSDEFGQVIAQNSPWVVTIDTTSGLYIRNQNNDDKKLGRIAVTESSSIAGPYVNNNGTGEQHPLFVMSPDKVSTENSSTAPLAADTGGIDHIFTGDAVDILNYAMVTVNIFTDVPSATDGLMGEQSSDGINWDFSDEFSIPSSKGKIFAPNRAARYFRIIYTNGTVAQSVFRLQTILNSKYVLPNSHRIKDTITDDDDAQLVKSVVSVQTNDDNTYKNVDVQNPLPTDGDSVYAKDLFLDECTPGDFIITEDPTADDTTILTSMVSDVWVEKKDDSATNPKVVTLAFKRPILTTSFGIDSGPDGDFSNVRIYVRQGQEEFLIVDESTDSTKYKIRLFSTAPLKFSEIRFEFHTADTVTTGLYGIFKHVETASRLQALDQITGVVADITSYKGALDVNSKWVTKIVNDEFHQHTGVSTNPTTGITAGDINVVVDDATGFSDGDKIKIEENVDGVGVQEVGIITLTDVTGSTLQFDRPVGFDYTVAASIEEVITNMAVSGTLASPEIFEIDPPLGTIWQFTRVLPRILDTAAMDDGLFGSQDALTNGVALRATTTAGRTVIFANWKTNGDMRADMYNVDYLPKAPAGQYGLGGKWTFTNLQIVAELDGDASPIQKLEVLIQDDITQDLFAMKGQGRVFSP